MAEGYYVSLMWYFSCLVIRMLFPYMRSDMLCLHAVICQTSFITPHRFLSSSRIRFAACHHRLCTGGCRRKAFIACDNLLAATSAADQQNLGTWWRGGLMVGCLQVAMNCVEHTRLCTGWSHPVCTYRRRIRPPWYACSLYVTVGSC